MPKQTPATEHAPNTPPPFDVTLGDITQAAARISVRVRRTPTYASPAISALTGAATLIKCEGLQLGGSFKLRGCFNKLLQLDDAARAAGVVTVSGGNHAIAVSLAASALGLKALVLMPQATPALNIALTKQAGGEVQLCTDAAEAFARAEELGQAGMTYIHPYDDPDVIAGHGTLGLELVADATAPLDHVFISIGGGGFAAGVSAALKGIWPHVRIHGVETEGATTMTQAINAGHPVSIKPSSIARTLGAPFVTERTLSAARSFLDEIVLVPDREAVRALFTILETERMLVEPAASAVLAAAMARRDSFGPDETIGLILCGSNVALDDALAWRTQFGL
ncbi:MAG: threonine ammonia-lyase [Bosea sp. (in: a-proteobacteria)]